MAKETCIQIGSDVYTRVRVTARASLANAQNTPPAIWAGVKAANDQLWWTDDRNPDLLHLRFVLDCEGANKNWDYMPRPQLLKGFSTAVYKPFDMEHLVDEQGSMVTSGKTNGIPPVTNTIFGVMTAAAVGQPDGSLLTADEIKALDQTDDWQRTDENKIAVIAWASLYQFMFPKTVSHIAEEIDNGTMAVSMERWLKSYDYMVWDGEQYKAVPLAEARNNGVDALWSIHQMVEGKPILRRALSYVYGGVAGTSNPAQPLSQFVAPSVIKAAASENIRQNEILNLLTARHGEIHQSFCVASCDNQAALITEHLAITRAIAALVGQ